MKKVVYTRAMKRQNYVISAELDVNVVHDAKTEHIKAELLERLGIIDTIEDGSNLSFIVGDVTIQKRQEGK